MARDMSEDMTTFQALQRSWDKGYEAGLMQGRKGFTVTEEGEIKHPANTDYKGCLLVPRDLGDWKPADVFCSLLKQVLTKYNIPCENFVVAVVSPANGTGDPFELNSAIHWRNPHRKPEAVPGNPEE